MLQAQTRHAVPVASVSRVSRRAFGMIGQPTEQLSQKPPVRQGRKGHLYGATHHEHPPPTPLEQFKIVKRRIEKAERDERMDVTMALTPVKDYMGGFTRPKDLRASNWFRGGRYRILGKRYECPPAAAYEPHTVFLLESRYPVNFGIGRVQALEYVVGVCRACDFLAVLERYNSGRTPEKEPMDNAAWPWLKQKVIKSTKWWGPGEDPRAIIEECSSKEEAKVFADFGWNDQAWFEEHDVDDSESEELALDTLTKTQRKRMAKQRRETTDTQDTPSGEEVNPTEEGVVRATEPSSSSRISTELLRNSASSLSQPLTARGLHTSSRQQQQHDEGDGSLMPELKKRAAATSMSTSVPQAEKVPAEHLQEDGVTAHTSGFVPPTPASTHEQAGIIADGHDAATRSSSAGMADVAPTDASDGDEGMHQTLDANSTKPAGKTPPTPPPASSSSSSSGWKRSLHSSAIARATEVGHAIPPHMQQPSEGREKARALIANEMENLSAAMKKPLTTQQLKQLTSKTRSKSTAPRQPMDEDLSALREQYLATLKEKPFWRPLLSMTVSTRPIGVTLARLSRGLERGLPFYASMSNIDRKCILSFSDRMRNLRIERMIRLTVETARTLSGERGGFVGLRFQTDQRGRGIDGEGLADPLPDSQRRIEVGVGEWYRRSEEVKEAFRMDADGIVGDPLTIFGLTEHGQRTDGVSWPEAVEASTEEEQDLLREALSQHDEDLLEEAVQSSKNPNVQQARYHKLRNEKRDQLFRAKGRDLALTAAMKHRSVTAA